MYGVCLFNKSTLVCKQRSDNHQAYNATVCSLKLLKFCISRAFKQCYSVVIVSLEPVVHLWPGPKPSQVCLFSVDKCQSRAYIAAMWDKNKQEIHLTVQVSLG